MPDVSALEESVISVNSGINTYIWYVAFAVILLLSIYFTFRGRCLQVVHLKETLRIFSASVKEKASGSSISSFQAFCTTMGNRIGVGNIAGIAMAIVMGGPGSIFWMWVFAFLLSAIAFVENTLGQIFKEKQNDGHVRGGPAYYVKNGLGKPKFAIVISVLLILLSFSFCGVQVNQACSSVTNAFPEISPLVIGVLISLAAAVIFFGGIKRVAVISSRIVPFIIIAYLAMVIAVIITNIEAVGSVFATIFTYAFGFRGFAGGGICAMLLYALKRSVFSTDAGIGVIPNQSSSADVSHPVKSGLIQAFGTWLDIIVCTASAIIILLYTNRVYPDYNFTELGLSAEAFDALKGAPLVSDALSATFLGSVAPVLFSAFMVLFAFSSLISHYFTCEMNVSNITQKPVVMKVVRLLLIGSIFVFSQFSLGAMWDVADSIQAVLCLCNLGVLIFLGKYAFEALRDYICQKKDGVREPVFTGDVLSNSRGVSFWSSDDGRELKHEEESVSK